MEDGGPAFPQTYRADGNSSWSDGYGGMTLRDYFAGQALALGGEFFSSIDDHQNDPPNEVKHAAYIAYAIADAMLIERQK